jgi:hypothetical protein
MKPESVLVAIGVVTGNDRNTPGGTWFMATTIANPAASTRKRSEIVMVIREVLPHP